jgi:hypothetical protein
MSRHSVSTKRLQLVLLLARHGRKEVVKPGFLRRLLKERQEICLCLVVPLARRVGRALAIAHELEFRGA